MNKNEQKKELTDKELEGVSGGRAVMPISPDPHHNYPRARRMQGLSEKELDAQCIVALK